MGEALLSHTRRNRDVLTSKMECTSDYKMITQCLRESTAPRGPPCAA